MSAIKEMIRLRGGIQNLEYPLQIKITRADVEGATDCVVPPYLVPFRRSVPTTCSMFPFPDPSLSTDLLRSCLVHCIDCKELKDVFLELLRLTFAIDHVLRDDSTSLHPRALDEDFIEIQHRLLLWHNNDSNAVDEGFRLGALIYAKSITRSISTVSCHTKILVQKLIDALAIMRQTSEANPLMAWLCLMGCVAASSQSPERSWFVNYLAGIVPIDSGFSTWADVESSLACSLWVKPIHEPIFRRAWNEVQFVKSTPLSLDPPNPVESKYYN